MLKRGTLTAIRCGCRMGHGPGGRCPQGPTGRLSALVMSELGWMEPRLSAAGPVKGPTVGRTYYTNKDIFHCNLSCLQPWMTSVLGPVKGPPVGQTCCIRLPHGPHPLGIRSPAAQRRGGRRPLGDLAPVAWGRGAARGGAPAPGARADAES